MTKIKSNSLDEINLAGLGVSLLPVDGQRSELVLGDVAVVMVVQVVLVAMMMAILAFLVCAVLHVRGWDSLLLLLLLARLQLQLARAVRARRLQGAQDLLAHAVRCRIFRCFCQFNPMDLGSYI